MRINHNLAAFNTNRQLSINNKASVSSLEKLSSGLRINRSADDAAGLAISEKMRGQIRGLNQASDNANDGISLIKTAEGGLNETHNILHRMRELAVQSANDTNTSEDRLAMQKEMDQLTKEITRIANDTEFNTQKLLDGSMMATMDVAGTPANPMSFGPKLIGIDGINMEGSYTGTLTVAGTQSAVAAATPSAVNLTGFNNTPAMADGNYEFVISNVDDIDHKATITLFKDGVKCTNPAFEQVDVLYHDNGASSNLSVGSGIVLNAYYSPNDYTNGQKIGAFTISTTTETSISWVDGDNNPLSEADAKKLESNLVYTVSDSAQTGHTITLSNFSDAGKIFHIGANEQQNTRLNIANCDAESLKVKGLSISSQKDADAAIDVVDSAVQYISSQRASLGAMQNRLEYAVNNLGSTSENLSAAESQIRDVDMAEQMSTFTKDNILSQAATSMLAQANQQPQNVLSLLQG